MKLKVYALTVNGKLLNEDGDYCKQKDTPAFALSPRAFTTNLIKENGWEVMVGEINLKPLP